MSDGHTAEHEAARERQSHVRHELRAPLAVMVPLVSLLTDEVAGPLTDRQREYLEVLERNTARLEALIASATETGWLECAHGLFDPRPVWLADVVDEVLTLRELRAGGARRVQVTVDDGCPPALADRDHVRGMVRCLVDNADRYTPVEGAVRVHIGTVVTGADAGVGSAGGVAVTVQDEGPGIAADELLRVFDFGFRGQAARAAGVPGLGIGLWVCRELAARNGGSVALQGAAGGGTIVTITLRCAGTEGSPANVAGGGS